MPITGLNNNLKKEKYIMFIIAYIIGLLYIYLNNVMNVIKMFETQTKRLLDSLKQKESQEWSNSWCVYELHVYSARGVRV